MNVSHFTRTFLLIFSGPIIWAAHFVAIYGFTGVACARGSHHAEWLGIGAVPWFIGISGLLALAAIATIGALATRKGKRASQSDASGVPAEGHAFIGSMTIMLGLLAAIAIVWESLPVLLVPICA
ncbi:hypothetical protein [Noviherbaspirillum sp.]|uniref:hypothetical protein n=1 Tax=Noviherbaspirillum sp. TaxID=1926288 RepID=UPI002FE2C35E